MKVALAQLNSTNDINKNLSEIQKIILESANLSEYEKPSVIFFPENSLFFRIEPVEKMQALRLSDPVFEKLKKLSQQTNIYLHLTTAIEDENKIWNASVLISPAMQIEILYKKIHLFDIALQGQAPIRESDVFSHGDKTAVFEIDHVKFGSSICYDVRFSELYSQYAKLEVDVILVPAAFLIKTGKAHWETLLKARAIESQAYVLAAAQCGKHISVSSEHFRETYGHTMAVSPWGEIIALKPTHTGVLFVDIETQNCKDVRAQIPMKNHRRLK